MDLHVLEETAQLAHLKADKDELSAALPAFEQMLEFFAAMDKADTSGADSSLSAGQAAGSALVSPGHFRGDTAPADSNRTSETGGAAQLNEKILNNAGDRDGRFIVIPNVL